MLTPQQITQAKAASAPSSTGSVGTPGQAMTPEQAQTWIQGTAAPQTPNYFQRVGSDISGAVQEGAQSEVASAEGKLNPVSAGINIAKNATAGVIAPVTEALAPVMNATVNPVIKAIADKVSDVKAVQDFAELMGKHPVLGQTISDLVQTGLNTAGLVGGEGTVAKGAEIAPKIASDIKESVLPKPVEPAVAKVAAEDQARAAQAKAHAAIADEIRNTAAKYSTVGKVLNASEVVRKTDPISVVSSYPNGKALPTLVKGKLQVDEPANFLNKQIKNLGEIKGNLVATGKKNIKVADFQKALIDKISKSQIWSQTKKADVRMDALKATKNLRAIYPKGIPNTEMDKIKTEHADLSTAYKQNIQTPFKPDTHSLIADVAREYVKKTGGDAPIEELNKLIASHKDAVKLLYAMRGKTPHGGMMTRMFNNTIGEVAGLAGGMAVGHPFIGAMVGRAGAEEISNIVNSHFISNPLKRSLINNMKGADPEVLQKANDYLDGSSPSSVPKGGSPQPTPNNIKSSPSPKPTTPKNPVKSTPKNNK